MANNTIILKTFNKQLTEFIDDISTIFPGEKDVVVLATFMKTVMYGKPRAIIDVWYRYIALKYNNEIENGEMMVMVDPPPSEDATMECSVTTLLKEITHNVLEPRKATAW